METLATDQLLSRIIVGLPRSPTTGGQQLKLIAKLSDDIVVTKYYMRKDGKEIFSTNTHHLRRLLNNAQPTSHVNIAKWSTVVRITINVDRTCMIIRQPYLPSKESSFAWQVLFRTLATNRWRFQSQPDPLLDKECKRCTQHSIEVGHCLWSCPKAAADWHWIRFVVPLTSQDPDQLLGLNECQALIGVDHTCSPAIPPKWWSALQICSLWHIWIHQKVAS